LTQSTGFIDVKLNCFLLGASLNVILQLGVFSITTCSSVCLSSSFSVYKILSPNEATKTVFFFWGNNLKLLNSSRKLKRYKVTANSLAIVHIQVFFNFCC